MHSEQSKLDKASFTGSCYALGNPKAATSNVKKTYQKCSNAWNHYWRAMLLCAWENMTENFPMVKEKLLEAREKGKDEFMIEIRSV